MTRFDPAFLLALAPRETTATHDERDVILYALAVGAAAIRNPAESLRFTYEPRLQVLPTMAVVLASPGFWLAEPQYGVNWKRVLHAGQTLTVHRPLPVAATLLSRLTIEDIYDRGDKGALLYSRRDIHDESGTLLATEKRTTLLGGDGGKGGRTNTPPMAQAMPDRSPDMIEQASTRPDQALLYRLCGDRNPLHADPAVASQAGFHTPILHGLCTYGIVGHALLRSLCDDDPARFRNLECRFTAPVYPGETVLTEIWREGRGRVAFRAKALERDAVVVNFGRFDYDSN